MTLKEAIEARHSVRACKEHGLVTEEDSRQWKCKM